MTLQEFLTKLKLVADEAWTYHPNGPISCESMRGPGPNHRPCCPIEALAQKIHGKPVEWIEGAELLGIPRGEADSPYADILSAADGVPWRTDTDLDLRKEMISILNPRRR